MFEKLRIGIWIGNEIQPTDGGAYYYKAQILEIIKTLNNDKFDFWKIQYGPTCKVDVKSKTLWIEKAIKPFRYNYKIVNLFTRFFKKYAWQAIVKKIDSSNLHLLNSYIDVLYYPTSGVRYTEIPFIMTIWDLSIYTSFSFPETTFNGNFEKRDRFFKSIPQKAVKIIAESVTGKNEIKRYLGIAENKIEILPMIPSDFINPLVHPKVIDSLRGLKFIHYPATISPHKNHINLLFALKLLLKKHQDINLILTGFDPGNLEYVFSVAQQLEIEENVKYIGFVSSEELKWIYLNSCGLVFPSLIGPTNIPILDAAILGCPVACSDFEGYREQVADYAYYFNPLDVTDIADKIDKMLVNKDDVHSESFSFNLKNAADSLTNIFSSVHPIIINWKHVI